MDPLPRTFTIDDLQAATPRVLDRLRAMAELPQYGTVAGQAVASLFWEELGLPIRGPINDIDVFVNRALPRHMRGLPPLPAQPDPDGQFARKIPTSNHRTRVSTEYASYEHVKFLAMRFTTRILRTYAVDLVNYTLIENMRTPPGQPGHADDVSAEIVEGFDLNLVSVGINLETGNAAASPAFLRFLSDYKVKVQTCNTPSHTMVRLASKCTQGDIQGVSCDFEQQMDMLATAISCQKAHGDGETPMFGAIEFFGPKYRKIYGRFSHLLPPIEHVPTMDDARKIPGSENPPLTIDLYRLIVPAPTDPANKWLVESATKMGPFSGSSLLYLSHFPDLYEIAHPQQCGVDPAQAAIRRTALDELTALDKNNGNCELDGFGKAAVALDLEIFQSPVEGMDEKDQFAFFFGQRAAKNQAQADRAAAAFGGLTPAHRATLYALREGADTAIQFQVAPDQAWWDMIKAHGANLLNEWSHASSNAEPIAASDNIAIIRHFTDAIDRHGDAGTARLVSLLMDMYPSHHGEGLNESVFRRMSDLVGHKESLRFMRWLSTKVIPSWPDLSHANPLHASAIVRGWIASDHPCPAQAIATARGQVAMELIHRIARMHPHSASLFPSGQPDMPPPALLDDGNLMLSCVMENITMQDIFVQHSPPIITTLLDKGLLIPLVQRARNHPDSVVPIDGIHEAMATIKHARPQGHYPVSDPQHKPATRAEVLAFLNQMAMDHATKPVEPAPAARAMRF